MAFQFTDDHGLTETEKQIQVRFETCEKMLTPMVREYYKEFEAARISRMWAELMDADKAFSPEEPDRVIQAFDKYNLEIQADINRLSGEIQPSELKRIHVLQTEKKVSDGEYRELLARYGVSTSKDLNRMGAMMVIKRLQERK